MLRRFTWIAAILGLILGASLGGYLAPLPLIGRLVVSVLLMTALYVPVDALRRTGRLTEYKLRLYAVLLLGMAAMIGVFAWSGVVEPDFQDQRIILFVILMIVLDILVTSFRVSMRTYFFMGYGALGMALLALVARA